MNELIINIFSINIIVVIIWLTNAFKGRVLLMKSFIEEIGNFDSLNLINMINLWFSYSINVVKESFMVLNSLKVLLENVFPI